MAPAGMSWVNAFHALYIYPLEQLRQQSQTAEKSLEVFYGLNCQVMTYTPTLQLITEFFKFKTYFNDSCHHYVGDFAEFPKMYVKEYNEHFGEFSRKNPEKKPAALIALELYQQKPSSVKIDPFNLFDFDKLTVSQREFRAKMDGLNLNPQPVKHLKLQKINDRSLSLNIQKILLSKILAKKKFKKS